MSADHVVLVAGVPEPGDSPLSHLRHTLAVFRDTPDDTFAVMATSNVYAPRGKKHSETGLTYGDLRRLLALLEHLL